jgi:group I intron endonuclease
MSNKFGVIYKISNLLNGKVYIGQTIRNIEIRWKQHCREAIKYSHKSALFGAIAKYGKDAFVIEEVCSCTNMEDLNFMESFLIGQLSSLYPLGYNLTYGGGNHKRTPEASARLSKFRKGKPSTKKGKKYPGSNQKRSEQLKGKEQPKHLSDPLVRAKASTTRTGKKVTGKALENLQKGAKDRSKAIIDLTTNIIYVSGLEAAKHLGLKPSTVYGVASGQRNSAYGIKLAYIDTRGGSY